MILYALRCECDHQFDQWFDNMADYDDKRDSLTCPSCGGHKVSKAIMSPHVGKSAPTSHAPAPTCAPGGCASGMCPMMGAMG